MAAIHFYTVPESWGHDVSYVVTYDCDGERASNCVLFIM